jgi:hypothetical protein
MTGPEHYREAESALERAARAADREWSEDTAFWMQSAHVHATLAAAPGDDNLRQQVDGLREALRSLSGELAAAFTRISDLEERLHDHEQAVPHAESQA